MDDADLLSHLTQLELRVMHAAGRDAAVIDELLADDFLEFGRSGRRWDKAGVLAMQRTPGTHAVAREFALRRLADTCALLTYVSDMPEGGNATLRSSLWSLREGRWWMVFHQGTIAQE